MKTICDEWTLHNKLRGSKLIKPSVGGKILSNPVLFNKVGSFYSRLNYKGLF